MLDDEVRVITFPHDDLAFRAHVEAALAALGRWHGERVEAEVRKAYPSAQVRPASSLARLGAERATWYAYRDGRIVSRDAGEWWRDADLPMTVMTVDGRYVDANEAAVHLFGVTREEIVGARAGRFTRHEGSEEVARRLFEVLASTGTLHSTAVAVRPDGEECPVEFHMRRSDDGQHYLTAMRRI